MVSANDCVWIVSITGIDNHQIPAVHIGTVGAFTMSNQGPAILIFNKAAYTENNNYIISSTQLEHYNNCVDDVTADYKHWITNDDDFAILEPFASSAQVHYRISASKSD